MIHNICRRKLSRNNGETLVETLVSLLICVLSLGLLAMMIAQSTVLIRQGDEMMDSYYASLNTLARKSDEKTETTVLHITEVSSGATAATYDKNIDYYSVPGIGGTKIVSYRQAEDTVAP